MLQQGKSYLVKHFAKLWHEDVIFFANEANYL
jgi:hypothetical protein